MARPYEGSRGAWDIFAGLFVGNLKGRPRSSDRLMVDGVLGYFAPG